MAKVIIDNENRTITANFKNLSTTQKKEVKELQELGYTFIQAVVKRGGAKRNRNYYEGNLIKEDLELFSAIEEEHSYQTAVSFASMIIKLGKFVDSHPEKKETLDNFRNLALDDLVKAKLYFNQEIAA